MDPSKSQADTSDDAHSLEGAGTTVEPDKTSAEEKATNTSATIIDASSEQPSNTPEKPAPKASFLKRIWRKFNIYLLLLMLVILVAAAITVILFLKDRSQQNKNESAINSQNLSEDALKQLANSDVTVGNSKQVLKVESNAVFAGSVLVRNDLEVAGTIKVGGELQLPGITVAGDSRFNQLQADNLTIGSNAVVQGALTARKGLNVSGASNFDGALSATQISTNILQLNGALKLTHHITAGGPVPSLSKGGALGSGGTASLSGSDTTGTIVLNTGGGPSAGCFATITFARKFDSTPHVTVTPVGSGAAALEYYVNRSSSEFSVCTTNPAPAGQSFGFDYIILN